MSGILNLPDEILTKICIFCDLTTLFNVSLVSKRLNACFNTEILWKEKWERLTRGQGVRIQGIPRCKYRDMCRRFTAVFGLASHHIEADCLRCHSAVCDVTCFQSRDELIIFDFGSKTTWFKYASESTGQLSMHPTVGPSLEEGAANVIECCPICIKFAKRKTASMCDLSSPFPEVRVPRPCHHRRGLASALSKLSLRNLQCFDGVDSDDEADLPATPDAAGSGSARVPEPEAGSGDCPGCPDYVTMYKFLMKHMLRRNPFFQVRNIPFVICEPSQNSCPIMLQMVEFLLTDLKVPAVCFIPTPIAISLYTDLETCLVIDSGANNTVVTPVVGQRVVQEAARHSSIGGHHITHALMGIVKSKGIDGQIDEASLDSSRVKKECYLAYSTATESQKNIQPKSIEVKICVNGTLEPREVSLSHELYLVAEDMYLNLGLPAMIVDSLTSLSDVSTRKRLLQNIVLTGGNCRLAGLALRLTRDLQAALTNTQGTTKDQAPPVITPPVTTPHLVPPPLAPPNVTTPPLAPPPVTTSPVTTPPLVPPPVAVRVLDPRLMTGRTDAVIGASYIRKWREACWVSRRDYILWGPNRCLEKTEIV